ncbi:S1 family peptidase [bacterium]|nr:S1 family peptidase [bacterium]
MIKQSPLSALLVTTSLLLLSNCGGSNNGLTMFESGDPLTISELMSKAKLDCSSWDSDECPDNVAQMLRVATSEEKLGLFTKMREWGFAQCTAFVIDSQHVMTNAHCVHNKSPGSYTDQECKDNIGFIWADGSSRACSEIKYVAASFHKGDIISSEDIAIIKLDRPVTMDPVKLNMEGLPDKSSVHTWSVNPSSYLSHPSRLTKKTCEVMQNPSINASFNNDKAPFFFLSDCDVIPGNSGSPLFNKDSEVVGIVNSLIKDKQYKSYAGGMNMACINPLNHSNPWRSDLKECVPSFDANALSQEQAKLPETMIRNSSELSSKVLELLQNVSTQETQLKLSFSIALQGRGTGARQIKAFPSCYQAEATVEEIFFAPQTINLHSLSIQVSEGSNYQMDLNISEKKSQCQVAYDADSNALFAIDCFPSKAKFELKACSEQDLEQRLKTEETLRKSN